MTHSVPSENIFKINNLNEVPEKKRMYNHLVKKVYDEQMELYSKLDKSELEDLVNEYINEYNEYIDIIEANNNRLTKPISDRYNRLHINLIAIRDYLEQNNFLEEESELEEEEPELEEEESELENSDIDYSKLTIISSIEDLIQLSDNYVPEITFFDNDENINPETNNYTEDSINKLIEIFTDIDNELERYNTHINIRDDPQRLKETLNYMTLKEFKDMIIEEYLNLKNLSKLFMYYYYSEIEEEQKYPVQTVFYAGYSDKFNKMLFEDFNKKYQNFKKEHPNKKRETFMFFKYYYDNNPKNSHNTPMNDTNFMSVENILNGKTMIEILQESGKKEGSDPEITKVDIPVASQTWSFEFFNLYEVSIEEVNKILRNLGLRSELDNKDINDLSKLNDDINKDRVNREGQLFTYKINTQAFKDYFGDYSKYVIEYLIRLQIFEGFNPLRKEYNYNCLLYAIFMWFKEHVNEDFAQKICLDLLCFNFSRLTTLKDISVINKYFKDNAKHLGKRYKIKVYKQNVVQNKVKANGIKEKVVDYYIPVVLLESKNVDKLEVNHFMIHEEIDFMKIAEKLKSKEEKSGTFVFTEKDNEKLLRKINDLKGKSKNNNWKSLNSSLLIKYLFNPDYNFFIPFDNDEISQIIDEKDELKNKIKEKELYQMINEMTSYDISILQDRAFNKLRTKFNSKYFNDNPENINDFMSDVILNQRNYEWLCFYDFEADTHYEGGHKAYMLCYVLMKYPNKVLIEDKKKYKDKKVDYLNDLKTFIKDFRKNYKIHTIYEDLEQYLDNNEDTSEKSSNSQKSKVIQNCVSQKAIETCAEKFLKILPNNTLCYAHNVKYDLSFFDYSKVNIVRSCEKDGNLYSRDIVYDNKYFTFKDSYKLITSKLSEFPEMFKLGRVQKEIFPYDFYTYENLLKYKDKDFDINSREFKLIERDLINGFNEINYENKIKRYFEFRDLIKHKFKGKFNMIEYSKFYCERDVEILAKGLISMRTYLYQITALDCLKFLTISTIAHNHMINHVYSKTKEGEDLYTTSGILNQYIQSAVWGGVCTSYRNAKVLIDRVLSDFDAVSLYPSAIKRFFLITGKCKKFEYEQLEEINKSMNIYDSQGNVVGYDNKKCWLLENTNKEDEFDEKKINMYVVTIKIKDSKKKRDNPRIIVKNELLNGGVKRYPNLPVGNIMVNVDKNVDLNDYAYKYTYVNDCIVTIDNIMLEDYIKYHEIEFEVLAGVYWKSTDQIPLLKCFLELEYNLNLSEEDKIKYTKVINDKFEKYPEMREYYDNLVVKYHEKYDEIKRLSKKIKLTKSDSRQIVRNNKKLDEIKMDMNDIDAYMGETKSSKDKTIQEVIEKLFQDRLKYKKEGNPLQNVIKLLLNSVYGKTIQKPTVKKINYVRIFDDNRIDLNNKPEKTKKHIIDKYNEFITNYTSKLEELHNGRCLTDDDYNLKKNDIEKIINIDKDNIFTCKYSPIYNFIENNKNKILGMEKINDNMYRIETLEKIEEHRSFNHVGVQILSMSKRIMNEVICTAQDLKDVDKVNIYYQDTDSIHIEYSKIPLLAKKFKEKFNRDLIGKQLGQFHSDFEPCKLESQIKPHNNKSIKELYDDYYSFTDSSDYKWEIDHLFDKEPSITLSKLAIINAKKDYVDVKFNPECYFENFDINNDYNINLDNMIHKELDVANYIINNYHPRMKGVNTSGVVNTAQQLGLKLEEVYLKIFNYEKINFDLSKAKLSFQFTKYLNIISKELNRDIECGGNRYIFYRDGTQRELLEPKKVVYNEVVEKVNKRGVMRKVIVQKYKYDNKEIVDLKGNITHK